jgi:hypothetical protein
VAVRNLRELVGAAINSGSLEANPLAECAIDRIGALAFSDELGACLWRLKYGLHHKRRPERDFYLASVQLLARRLGAQRRQDDRRVVVAICGVVIHEWLHDRCEPCGGRGHRVAKDSSVRHTCTSCSGTGIGRHSDMARMRALGMDRKRYSKWESRFHAAHGKITDADTQAWRDVSAQLRDMAGHDAVEKLLAFARRRYTLRAIQGDGPAQSSNNMPDVIAVSSATG